MDIYRLKQLGRVWHERLKANINELGFIQYPCNHAVFCIRTWKSPEWQFCTFWVNDRTGVGSQHQLD